MIKTCEYCGQKFETTNNCKKYCTDICSKRAYNKRKGKGDKTYLPNEQSIYNNQISNDVRAHNYLDKYNLPFEYVDGYTNADGRANLKCHKCGSIGNYSIRNVRHGKVPRCNACYELERQAKAREKEKAAEERKQKAEQRKAETAKRNEEFRESKKRTLECEICGKTFITYNSRVKTCSAECGKKRSNRISSRAKDKRLTDRNNIDKDITLESLFKRDAGVCYICGGKCNWEDYTMRGDVFIAGDWYPSVEHVIPIARGGLNAWSNVRLAHRRCNYLKSDKLNAENNGQLNLF